MMVARAHPPGSSPLPTGEQMVVGTLLDAWQRLLRANCVIMRVLDAELHAEHGMTLSDYDVLVSLRAADDCSLRMSDLSRRTLLTRSGMTRLVQGLERDGLVERRACDADARVSYAVLTDLGHERLERARSTHHAEPRIRSRLPPRTRRLVVMGCFRQREMLKLATIINANNSHLTGG